VAFESHHEASLADIRSAFETIAGKFAMSWHIHDCRTKARVLIMVSRFGHCLNDPLFRHAAGDLKIEIPAIVSNHPDFEVEPVVCEVISACTRRPFGVHGERQRSRISIMRWGDNPDHLGRNLARIAASMNAGASEGETVTLFQPE
jgi:hypothetical protein